MFRGPVGPWQAALDRVSHEVSTEVTTPFVEDPDAVALGDAAAVRNRCRRCSRKSPGIRDLLGIWTRTQCLRTSLDHLFRVELRDLPPTPVYQKIAAEAAEVDVGGACISLMARHFGVDPKTVMKAIAWFHVGRQGS